MPDLSTNDLRYLLTLPPQEIVKWYQSKGYRFSWNWFDTWQAAHTRAFTVAKAMKLEILQAIKNKVDEVFEKGITYEQFKKDLEPVLKELGWWGKVRADQVPGYNPDSGVPPEKVVELGTPRRLFTIYQTNANVAYNAGRYNFFMQNVESRPYWMYLQIDRKNKRKEHSKYHGKVFRHDDPIWDTIFPPNGWGCGCYIIALTQAELIERGLKLSKGSDIKIENIQPEWKFNPAKEYTNWQPDLSKYDEDIKAYF